MNIEIPGIGIVQVPDNVEPEVVRKAARRFMEKQRIAALSSEIAQEQGAMGATLIGAGKSFTDIGRGAQDLFYRATGDDEARAELQQLQEKDERTYGPLKREYPIATAVGESAPYVGAGGAIGAGMRGAGLAARLAPNLAAQGAGGAAVGGLTYAPTMEERGTNALIEGALSTGGEALGRVLSRIYRPGMASRSQSALDLAAEAENLGYRVRPASRLTSESTKNVIEGGMEALPGSAQVFDALSAQNQATYNRQVAQAIGENTDELTGEVLDSAQTRMGEVFNRVLSKDIDIALDDDFFERVIDIDNNRIRPMLLPPEDPIKRIIDNAYEMLEKEVVTGKELHVQQSRLGKAARAELRKPQSDPEKAFALFDLQQSLLDLAQRSIPAEDAELLQQTRQQYRHFSNLLGSKAIDAVSGDVDAGRLGRFLETRDRHGYLLDNDRSPFYQGTRFLHRVQPPLRTSGTAERSYMGDVLKTAGLGIAGGLGTGYVSGEDMLQHAGLGAGTTLASMIVAPNLMARAYLRPAMSRWLTSSPGLFSEQALRAGSMAAPRGLLE